MLDNTQDQKTNDNVHSKIIIKKNSPNSKDLNFPNKIRTSDKYSNIKIVDGEWKSIEA